MKPKLLTPKNVEKGDICLIATTSDMIYPTTVTNTHGSLRFTYNNDGGNIAYSMLRYHTDLILIKKDYSEIYFSKHLLDKINKLNQ